MDVDKQMHLSAFQSLANHLFDLEDLDCLFAVRINPLAV